MKDNIIRMARKAHLVMYDYDHPSLERFAALVAAAEREACAKTIDEMHLYGFDDVREFEIATLQDAAKAIRARGQA
jgi:hypothetical protein